MATWCIEGICRMQEGLVHHEMIIPAALFLPLLRGAAAGRAGVQKSSCTVTIRSGIPCKEFRLYSAR